MEKIMSAEERKLAAIVFTDIVGFTELMGREVRTLVNNQQSAGYKSVVWDATNDLGQPVSAGMYLYRIFAEEFVQVKKMVLLK
jgi:flagellar hook assembly protein FlgD